VAERADSVAEAGGGAVRPLSGNSQVGFLPPWRRSLTWRLAMAYLLTTLSILIGLSVGVYSFTAFYLDERLETELSAQADFYAAYAASLASDERALVGLAPTIAGLFAPQADLTVRFFAASDGALLAATQDIGPQPSRAALRELRYRSPTLFAQPSRDLPQRRYAARSVTVGERTIGVVEVSRSTLATDRFLSTLRYILMGTILVAALASTAVSIVLARRVSRPIRHIEQATRRIAADIDPDRLPPTVVGTVRGRHCLQSASAASVGDLAVRLDRYPPDEVGRLAQGINHMAGRLRNLEAARARFISEISHDLRTPLTALKGLLVNLIDEAEPDKRVSLEIAERETDRLIRLVNQLLDFSRWQGGRLELKKRPVDAAAIGRDALVLVEGRALHRDIALRASIPPEVPSISADPDRLQRVILNLLDNAIKFTPGGGEVMLTIAEREHWIEVSVSDTGRGMTAEERSKAFEPYYRGQGGGAGLGLAIARAVVEAHGGRMGIESDPGRGSRVWFTLPL